MIVPTITTIHLNKFDMNFDIINKTSIEFKVLAAKSVCRLKDVLTFKLEQLHNSIYVDNTVIDNLDFKYRLSVIYILLQQKHKILKILNLGLKAKFNSITQTISNVFYGIGAVEREIYDLFGVFFKDHPDLRRVLSDYGFRGNPLKKDFPLTGTTEIFFSIIKKILIFKPLKLSQEMRVFEYESPWIMNNDFSNYPKTEEEDDIEMEVASNMVKTFTILFFFYLFSRFKALDFTSKPTTCPQPLNLIKPAKNYFFYGKFLESQKNHINTESQSKDKNYINSFNHDEHIVENLDPEQKLVFSVNVLSNIRRHEMLNISPKIGLKNYLSIQQDFVSYHHRFNIFELNLRREGNISEDEICIQLYTWILENYTENVKKNFTVKDYVGFLTNFPKNISPKQNQFFEKVKTALGFEEHHYNKLKSLERIHNFENNNYLHIE